MVWSLEIASYTTSTHRLTVLLLQRSDSLQRLWTFGRDWFVAHVWIVSLEFSGCGRLVHGSS